MLWLLYSATLWLESNIYYLQNFPDTQISFTQLGGNKPCFMVGYIHRTSGWTQAFLR